MTPAETLQVNAEVEASDTYQALVFATALEIVRRRKQFTVTTLAVFLGVKRTTLDWWLRGARLPRDVWRVWERLALVANL